MHRFFATLLAIHAIVCLAVFGADFKVNVVNGVPRVERDGTPVALRAVYGGPHSDPVFLKTGDQTIVVRTAPIVSEECDLTFHLRFPRAKGEYFIDDFEIVEETSGKALITKNTFDALPYGESLQLADGSFEAWPRNSADKSFGVGIADYPGEPGNKALRIHFEDVQNLPPDPHLYTVPIRTRLNPAQTYIARFRLRSPLDGVLTQGYYIPAPSMYRVAMSDAKGTDNAFKRQVRYAHDAGADFVTMQFPVVWPKPGEDADFSGLDELVRSALSANPGAYIIPRIDLYAPYWWLESHPDENVRWAPEFEGRHGTHASVSSTIWFEEAMENLKKTILHLEATFPENLAGYHICNLETHEWFYDDSWGGDYHGYSPCEVKAFRKWLEAKYALQEDPKAQEARALTNGHFRSLQEAWGDPKVTFENAQPPTADERRNAITHYGILDPTRAQRVIDHNEFLQDAVANAICESARRVKEWTDGKRLTLYFYGYIGIFSGMDWMGASGHLANMRVLACPDVDILCSPINYGDRGTGGAGVSMSIPESVLHNGKIWLNEDDLRTYLAKWTCGTVPYIPDRVQSRDVLLRNTAQELVKNLGNWWMDLPEAGWFDDPFLWETGMKPLHALLMQKLANPKPYRPVIASATSEQSAVWTQGAKDLRIPASGHVIRCTLARVGASDGQYYLEDLLRPGAYRPDELPKVLILGNAWVMSKARRAEVRSFLNPPADVSRPLVIWCHAPGAVDVEKGFDLENTRELTGFRLIPRAGEEKVGLRATESGRKAGLPHHLAVHSAKKDNLAVQAEDGDLVLAVWEDDGAPAILVRGDAFYCATTEIPRELILFALQTIGEHIYTRDNLVFYTDEKVFVLHATRETPPVVKLSFPKPVLLKNLLTGKQLSETPRTTYEIPMTFAETLVLEKLE